MTSTPARDLPGPRPENQRRRVELRGARHALIGVLVVVTALAVVGGLSLLVGTDGHLLHRSPGLPVDSPSLRGTGVLLIVMIGATQALASVLLLGHYVRARAVALAAALILVGWATLQMMLHDDVTWFQMTMAAAGGLEVLLVAGCTPRKTPGHEPAMRNR